MNGRLTRAVATVCVCGVAASVASGQSSLATIFAGGTQGTAGGAMYFDLTTKDSPIEITGLDTNINLAAGSGFGFEVFTKVGTYVGNTANAAAWTSGSVGSGTTAGANQPSIVNLGSTITLNANTTYGIVLVHGPNGGPTTIPLYTAGNGSNQAYSNQDLSLALGAAQATPFVSTAFTPRVWNGRIKYNVMGTTGACCLFDGSCVVTGASNCAATGGIYRGDNSPCATANCPQPPTGACCFADGGCVVKTQAQCLAAAGVYSGDNVICAFAACVQPGACCFADGSCAVVTAARCTSSSGTYRGNGTACATGNCWTAPVLWNNAKFVTHPGQGLGGANASQIPAGANTLGENQNLGAGVRLADNFTVPTGDTWTVNKFVTFGYQTATAVNTTSTFSTMVVRIWDRDPTDPNAVSLFGDITTNVLSSHAFANVFRTGANLQDGLRAMIRLEASIPNLSLNPGTYWVEWSTTGTGTSGPFIPPVTLPASLPTGNALIWRNVPWVPVIDTTWNLGQYPAGQPIDLPFLIEGTRGGGTTCYANCDNSTIAPCLNVNDFTCFLNLYSAGNSYANCDASTIAPVLNVNDFTCFLNTYGAGCGTGGVNNCAPRP